MAGVYYLDSLRITVPLKVSTDHSAFVTDPMALGVVTDWLLWLSIIRETSRLLLCVLAAHVITCLRYSEQSGWRAGSA